MATFVLVHGAAHGGWCYRRVARLLRQAGHEVYAPTMTGVGERSHLLGPDVDLSLHIQDVVAVLHYEDLRDVILVGHSYGGMIITGVGDRAGDRVGKLVYLDAVHPKNGQSMVDIAVAAIEMTRSAGETVDGVELVFLPSPPAATFFGVTEPADVAWMADRLTGHPWRCFAEKLELLNEAELGRIPEYHIVCSPMLVPHDPAVIRAARSLGRVGEIDTGHDLMITEPQKVTEALLAIATR